MGSDESVNIRFLTIDASNNWAGGISLHFTSPPQYNIWDCKPKSNFPTALPSAIDKIWTISLTKTTSIGLAIHCNDKEVLDFVFSDALCTDHATWNNRWQRDVAKIKFTTNNIAGDYYRSGEKHA